MIAAIENAMLARFKAASDAGVLGYRFATLDSYPAEWDAYFREKNPRAPGAWVVFAGFADGHPVGFGGTAVRARFGVVVMAENARNETAQRQGGPNPAEPGSYQLAEDVIGILAGQDLGLPIGSLEVHGLHFVRTQAIAKERKISMLALELSSELLFDPTNNGITPAPEAIGDFATFHVDWDVPPFGGIDAAPGTPDVQLPDDAHADAVDHVTLETSS